MPKQTDFIKTALRVPPELHAAVHQAARKAERSFNAELITRLRASFPEQQNKISEEVPLPH